MAITRITRGIRSLFHGFLFALSNSRLHTCVGMCNWKEFLDGSVWVGEGGTGKVEEEMAKEELGRSGNRGNGNRGGEVIRKMFEKE